MNTIRTKTLITATLLMVAVILNAQNKSAGINLSLWDKVSTQPLDSLQTTWLNIGVYTKMNRLRGFGINILGSATQREVHGIQLSGLANIAGNEMYGLQVSGLANIVGDEMRGIQVAGITNVTGDQMKGISASGMVNIAGDESRGVMLTGFANITGDDSRGMLISGLLNITGDRAKGVHLSGMGNIVGENFQGIMASGLLGVVGDVGAGLQIAGVANIIGDTFSGLQFSGVGNVVGDDLQGIQLAPFNFAGNLRGLQVGLVNYRKKSSKGFQLGLVNANPDTRVQVMLFGGNSTKINAGVRFKNELFYTILGLGTHYLDFSDKFSAATFYRAGLSLPLYKSLAISGDLGYQHIETFDNEGPDIPARLYALEARLNLEYSFTKMFGMFVTGGYGGSRYYNKSKTFDKGIIAEAGVIIR